MSVRVRVGLPPLSCERFVCGDTLRFPLHVFRVFWIAGSARVRMSCAASMRSTCSSGNCAAACVCVRARSVVRPAHTCHHGFVPPFQQLLRDVTDADRSGRVRVWLHE